MEDHEIKLYLEKSSNRAALLSSAGIVIVIGSIIFGYFQLNALQNKSEILDQQIMAKKKEVETLNSELQRAKLEVETTKSAFGSYNQAVKEVNPLLAQAALTKTVRENPQADFANYQLAQLPNLRGNEIITKNAGLWDDKVKLNALIEENEAQKTLISKPSILISKPSILSRSTDTTIFGMKRQNNTMFERQQRNNAIFGTH